MQITLEKVKNIWITVINEIKITNKKCAAIYTAAVGLWLWISYEEIYVLQYRPLFP